jgi:GNAT superfamily N-acetyltransferase/uncharacterized RmlC-like cupin family protein
MRRVTAASTEAAIPASREGDGTAIMGSMDEYSWTCDDADIDWDELSELYRIAPLGVKPPAELITVFANSMFKCFAYAGDRLVAAGRASADGLDCSYIADVAVHPAHQGRGLGTAVIGKLVELSADHKKVILYANPGTEDFYAKLGFHRMNTAMAIWRDAERAIASGLISAISPRIPSTYPEPRYLGAEGEVTARVRHAGAAPDLIRRGGNTVHYLATGSSTDGLFGLYKFAFGPEPGGGARPHFHRTISESFFVLSGTIQIFDGRTWRDAEVDDFVHVPPGGIHGFRNESRAPASMLIHFAPGAPREAYFEGLDRLDEMSGADREAFFKLHDNQWLDENV